MNTSELITNSQRITIILPLAPNPQESQRASILACGLAKLGKEISIEKENPTKPTLSPSSEKTFAVSLKGLAPWISKVYYEKHEKDLKLYFTLQQGEILPENLSIQTHAHPDITIIMGNREAQHNGFVKVNPSRILEQEATKAMLDILFLQDKGTTKLLSVVLQKLRYIEKFRSYTAFLRTQDFQSSQTNPKALIPVIQDLNQYLDTHASHLLFYEDTNSQQIQAVFHKGQSTANLLALSQENVQQKGNWTIFSISPGAFRELTDILS